MRALLVIFSILAVVGGYEIKEIVNALSANFQIETGAFSLFNITQCYDRGNCFGTNSQTPYVEFNFSSWGGTVGSLQADEAILVVQTVPPTCRYFGFTPYIFSRANLPTILFASLSDTLNMNEVQVGPDGAIAIVSSPNPNITATIIDTLSQFLDPNSTNVLPLPGELLNFGTDTFTYLCRYELFENETAGMEFLEKIPGNVYKLTPNYIDTSVLFPYPTFRPYGPVTDSEHSLQGSLNNLVSAMQAAITGQPIVTVGIDIGHHINYQNGFTCINNSLDCAGDNRDAREIYVNNIFLPNSPNSFTWVAGVQHQATGKATYMTVAAYDQTHALGVLYVPDFKMNGSAIKFLPNDPNANYLYAIKFARSCQSEPWCFEIPVYFPGVPYDAPIYFSENVYVEPVYDVAPPYDVVLLPTFLTYGNGTSNGIHSSHIKLN